MQIDIDRMSRDMAEFGNAFLRIDGPPPRQFQVLGERGSGTNVVRKTLMQNTLLFRTDGLGWKHGFPYMVGIPEDMLVLCAFRNAVPWSLSMHKRPWHADPELQKLTYSEFIRSEWRSIVDRPGDFEQIHPEMHVAGRPLQFDRHPLTGEPFENLFALRRAKMQAILGMRHRGCHLAWVQLESLQSDPEGFLARLRAAFDADAKWDHYNPVKRRMGNRFNDTVKNRPETPSEMPPEDYAFMLSQLDLETERLLGYTY